jgi:plastocyanin
MSGGRNRESLLLPIAIPLGLMAVILAVLFGFSRVLLSVTPTAAWIVALTIAFATLLIATFVAGRSRVTGSITGAMVAAVLGVALFAGGIAVAMGPAKEKAPAVAAQTIPLSASNNAAIHGFDQKGLTWSATAPVNVVFNNADSTAHTFYIAASAQTQGSPIFAGEPPVQGGTTLTYPVQKLAAGTYYFFCSIHPTTMNGTLVVTPGAPGAATVTAHNLSFSTNKLNATAGQAFAITFNNNDPGVQHNIGIYTDANYTNERFKGNIITGVDTATYNVPPLTAGTYYFKCDIHPTMTGTLIVAAGAGGGGPGSGSASPSASGSATP